MGSLNSMDVFVCICTVVTDDWVGNNDEAVFFWVGRHATLALQEHGAKVQYGMAWHGGGTGDWLGVGGAGMGCKDGLGRASTSLVVFLRDFHVGSHASIRALLLCWVADGSEVLVRTTLFRCRIERPRVFDRQSSAPHPLPG